MFNVFDRAIAALTLSLAAVAFVVAAVGFFVASLFLALDVLQSRALAALICGGVLLALALVVVLIARVAVSGHGRGAAGPRSSPSGMALHVGQNLGESVRSSLEEKTPNAMLVALAAGFALGVSPRLRRTLMRLLQ